MSSGVGRRGVGGGRPSVGHRLAAAQYSLKQMWYYRSTDNIRSLYLLSIRRYIIMSGVILVIGSKDDVEPWNVRCTAAKGDGQVEAPAFGCSLF